MDALRAGPLVDALGVKVSLSEGQHLVEAVVVGKVVGFDDGGTSLVIASSDGLDWISQRGLLAAAADVLLTDLTRSGTDD